MTIQHFGQLLLFQEFSGYSPVNCFAELMVLIGIPMDSVNRTAGHHFSCIHKWTIEKFGYQTDLVSEFLGFDGCFAVNASKQAEFAKRRRSGALP